MANTLFIGKVYHRFDELSSTNDYARDLLAKSTPPEGTVVQAVSQSAGRGQYGSSWESAPGKNLTISVIFYPFWIPVRALFRFNEAMALAVRDAVLWALKPAGPPSPEVRIKWPNDLYIGDSKAAGILIQNIVKDSILQASIVGIGLNVNQTAFPDSVPNPTALAKITGRPLDLDACTEYLLECLEQRYLQLKTGNAQRLRAEYHQQLYCLGVKRPFERADGSSFLARVTGVDDDGNLRLLHEAGHTETFGIKAIKFSPLAP